MSFIAFLISMCAAWAQGPLAPPSAPTPTMRTLEQVEPRIPISNIPTTIMSRGSYYLTTNLVATGAITGITIQSDDVTLDLNGFTLRGVAGSLEGIFVSDTRRNITIRNGVVREWGRDGVEAGDAQNSSLEYLKAYTNGWGSTFQDGLRIGVNSRVVGCQAQANQDDGIETAAGCTITDAAAYNNGNDGIFVGDGCTITDSTAYLNGDDGIETERGCTITDSTAAFSGDDGIVSSLASTVSRCTAIFNTGDGIEVAEDCAVAGNTCKGNGFNGDGAGIHATFPQNRIDGNNVTDNDRGIDVDMSGNLIIRNSASLNTSNYAITGVNRVGPIDTGAGAPTNHPWANFAF
jgi:parallel beta-helix repeat protein